MHALCRALHRRPPSSTSACLPGCRGVCPLTLSVVSVSTYRPIRGAGVESHTQPLKYNSGRIPTHADGAPTGINAAAACDSVICHPLSSTASILLERRDQPVQIHTVKHGLEVESTARRRLVAQRRAVRLRRLPSAGLARTTR